MGISHIYVLAHSKEPFTKIGKANTLQGRIRGLGVSNFDLSKSFAYRVGSEQRAFNFEKVLHNVFADRRLTRSEVHTCVTSDSGLTEWFCVPHTDVKQMCDSLYLSFNATPVDIKVSRKDKQPSKYVDPYSDIKFLRERLDTILKYNETLSHYNTHYDASQDSVIHQLRARIQEIEQV